MNNGNEYGLFFEYPEDVYNTLSAERIVPQLMEWFRPSSVLDVGCGNGSWLSVFAAQGVTDLVGTDFNEPDAVQLMFDPANYRKTDLRQPLELQRKFELALCLEVAEHLEAVHAEQLINSLTQHADIIVFSAAIPGQGGKDHLNEQPPAYWQELFSRKYFHCFDMLRPLIWDDEEINWWYRQNIFIAARKERLGDHKSQPIHHLIHPEFHYEKMKYKDIYIRRFNKFLYDLASQPPLALEYLKRGILQQAGMMNEARKKFYKWKDDDYWSRNH